MFSLTECLHLACILEATARKPGNVHRFVDFADLSYLDFLLSAAAVAPILSNSAELGVGWAVLESIQATRRFVTTNTNLGIVLLLAPLAAVPRNFDLQSGIRQVLDRLDLTDSQAVFEAIRLVQPGGLGKAAEQDVHGVPTLPLKQIMALAEERDLIARQYARNFHDVFEIGVPALRDGLREIREDGLETAIILCHLRLLAALPETHIQRRCGLAEAQMASTRAAHVLDAGWPHSSTGRTLLAEFDAWLRANGHARNPGSTADLVTACLFAALRDDMIQFPARF
jgi:triphosphoribosyl-dephospho-CoA synthase